MAIIKIDDKEFDTATLPAEAKQQLQMLQFVEGELARIQAQGAVLKTAQMAYANALKQALPASPPPFAGDTLKLG